MATGSDEDPEPDVPWSAVALAAILDHVPSSVGVWDADLRNEYLNAAGYDALAIDGDVRGRQLADLVGGRIVARVIEWIRRAQAGERQQFMRAVQRADGREEHYDVEYLPIPAEDGRSTSIVAIGVDVTAQVTADVLRRDVAPFLDAVRDRERLAGELEDTVAIELDALARDLAASAEHSPAVAPALMQAAALTDAAVEQLDGLLHRRTRVGSGLQFSAVAEQVVAEAATALGFRPAFALRGPVERISPALAGEILAVLGEALNNVVRHADATEVVVAVSVTSSHVSLTVADDGVGVGDAEPGGGMHNLRSRAERIGGTCDWQSLGADGTLLEWRIPLDGSVDRASPSPPSVPPLTMPVATHVGPVPGRSIGLSARRLLLVLDELPSVIVVWDTDLRLEFANVAGVAWFGAGRRGDVLGRPMSELLPPGAYYATRPFVRAALAGQTQQFERSGTEDEGEPFNIRVIYTPRVEGGTVTGFVAQIFDISARLHAQEELQASMQQMTALEERRRIAEDLHDIVIQHLFAAGLRLDSALRVGEVNRPEVAGDSAVVQEFLDRVDRAIARLRESIATLRTNPAQPSSSPG